MVSRDIPGDGKDFGVLNPYNITHEDAKFNSQNLPGRERYAELVSNTRPMEPEASSAQLCENQQKYGNIFRGLPCGFHTRVPLYLYTFEASPKIRIIILQNASNYCSWGILHLPLVSNSSHPRPEFWIRYSMEDIYFLKYTEHNWRGFNRLP
jgi:hypothetical protein